MSHPRQQRATRNRRIVQLSQPAQVAQLAPSIVSIVGSTLTLQLSLIGQPPTTTVDAHIPILSGVPQIRNTRDDSYPISAGIVGVDGRFAVNWPGASNLQSDTFAVGPYDPAVRSYDGGYMAPGIIGLAQPPGATVSYTATWISGTQVSLDTIGAGLRELVAASRFVVVELGQTSSAVTIAGTGMVVTFAGPITVGMHIQYQGILMTANGDTLVMPFATSVAIE